MLALDAKTTALVLIDLQQGILTLPLTPHDAAVVIERSASLGQALARAGGLVVPVTVAFADDYADRPSQPTDAGMAMPAGGPPEGWATLAPAIAALPARVRITKRQQSAFYGTELDLQLRRRGVTTIVLCGVATNFGVEATTRDAQSHNYAVVVASDACSSVAPDLHDFAIAKILPRVARVRTTAEIVAALQPL